MTEYTQRLSFAEFGRTLGHAILGKYVLDTGDSLMTATIPQLGPHLLIWDTQVDAERGLTRHRLIHPTEVASVVKRMSLASIVKFISDNRDLSVYWHFSDGENRSFTSELFLSIVQPMTTRVEVEAEFVKHPSLNDHVVQLLELKRIYGLSIADSFLPCPLNCPHCDHAFSLVEPVYRAWRDGDIKHVTCPACTKDFTEAQFFTLPCTTCKAHSGFMPPVVLAEFTVNNPFVCIACQAAILVEQSRATPPRLPETARPESSGCLLLIATIVTSCLAVVYIVCW